MRPTPVSAGAAPPALTRRVAPGGVLLAAPRAPRGVYAESGTLPRAAHGKRVIDPLLFVTTRAGGCAGGRRCVGSGGIGGIGKQWSVGRPFGINGVSHFGVLGRGSALHLEQAACVP